MSTTSSTLNYFVLADSHAKYTRPQTTSSSCQITVKSISGLKWFDRRQLNISAYHQLENESISDSIASSKAIMCLIGSNSVRSFSATECIEHLKDFLYRLRRHHNHLMQPNSVTIVLAFPCQKTSYSFPTIELLMYNINKYNRELIQIATSLNVQIIDFNIRTSHLSFDGLHIHRRFSYLIPNKIFEHFDTLALPTTSTRTHGHRRPRRARRHRNHRYYERHRH